MFVDPGAFINMFMGVGILKVKSLFRKLRKLALRYGGVVVFFDEADSLGNRGRAAAAGGRGVAARSSATRPRSAPRSRTCRRRALRVAAGRRGRRARLAEAPSTATTR